MSAEIILGLVSYINIVWIINAGNIIGPAFII